VGVDVVGVGVAARLVVGDEDVRAHLADHPDERLGGDVEGLQREAPGRQGRQRVALGQPRVDEPEPDVVEPDDLLGRAHLVAAYLGDVPQDVGVVLEAGVEDVAALAAGA
jgi:hypothetical protein